MSIDRLEDLKQLLPQCLLYDQVRIGSRLAVLLRQTRGAGIPDADLQRLHRAASQSAELRARRAAARPELRYAESLPVTQRRAEIVEAIRTNPVVVIAGETGSGKTTQIPKMCLEAGFGNLGRIGCTQPRRVAALSISRRVAEELSVPWGKQVGCKIRFSDETSGETILKFMTDGILLAEVQGDPNLTEYEVLVIDEAHERSLNIDFLLGHLRQLVERRPDLRLVITSATIDTARFSEAFGNAPILEVSGRLFPVEVEYAPLDEFAAESGDQTYVDAAATAIEDVLTRSSGGDVLVFLPGERDIRELKDLMTSRGIGDVDVIPLFGRLSGSDQQRAFSPSALRKVVLATNIAETSITLPGIRYVIDTGLARISRYNSRTRTKRLPVEPISKSSAAQRQGRSGRVAQGVCIRLYSQEDFESRPAFTQPEIQRCNLAEVILRMKAAQLGEIETFPFLEPATPTAIRSGYELLRELGALNEQRELTHLGADLARLPVDPTIGRIVLQSHREGVLEEVLVIASGLSIQDPRERPMDDATAAQAAHKRFQHPGSDFLTLLHLWETFHDQWEKLRTQNQLRRFCKTNFLSYLRMREWVDIHAQLSSTFHETLACRADHDVEEDEADTPTTTPNTKGVPTSVLQWKLEDPKCQGIHRSILAGLLGHVAIRTERNLYKALGNRQVAVFPGSGLHDKAPVPAKTNAPATAFVRGGQPPEKASQPAWVVAGEIVETSRLFIRTLAGIDPEWIVELGDHLCKRTYDLPGWDAASGQVSARERITFHGLEIRHRRVAYGPIQPVEATQIFIRSALVEEGLLPDAEESEEPDVPRAGQRKGAGQAPPRARPPGRQRWQVHSTRFLEHNRALREKIETWRTRTRHHGLGDLDDLLFRFYANQLSNVSSVPELNRILRGELEKNPDFLCATEKDWIGDVNLEFDAQAFPSNLQVGDHAVPIAYAYAPGETHDGATLRVPMGLLPVLKESQVVWSVPGLREEQIDWFLRELPKALRKELLPLAPKVKEIVAEFRPSGSEFLEELADFVSKKYRVAIPRGTWSREPLPHHLNPRVEVIGPDQKSLRAGRDLAALQQQLATVRAPAFDVLWNEATQQWEKFGITTWSLGSVPSQIDLRDAHGNVLIAYPGLKCEEGEICLRLFRKASEAQQYTPSAWARLLELSLSREFAWMQKDLRALDRCKILYATLGSSEELVSSAVEHLRRALFPPPSALDEAHFRQALESAREKIRGIVPPFIDSVAAILQRRQELMMTKKPYAGLREDLEALLPKRFLEHTPAAQLPHLLRYLKAMQLRAERAALNTHKDAERAAMVRPFAAALQQLRAAPGLDLNRWEAFRWQIEEFKVSVFAQELGTAYPISAKRLQSTLDELRS